MAASTVTGNTSVVLVSSPQSKVYLSSVGYPGHIVTIKDLTGVASQGDPIVVSTTNGVFFADGSVSTLLVDPFSYLTVSSKTPTTWQILNNLGYLTTLSNAFVNTLTAGNTYTQLTSSVREYVSSSEAQTVNVTQSLTLLGNVDILGNVTINGTVDLFSTLNVNEDIRLSSGLVIQGAVSLQSTLSIRNELIVGGTISTLNDVNVGEDLYIGSSLYVRAALVPKNLSVQTLTMTTMNLGAGLFTAGGLSVGCNAFIGGSLTTLSSFLVLSSITILDTTTIRSTLTVQKQFTTRSLESLSSGVVFQEAMVGAFEVTGTLSTPNSLLVGGTLVVRDQTNVDSVVVTGNVTTNSLLVNGNAEISSIQAQGSVNVLGSVLLLQTLQTSSLQAGITTVDKSLEVFNATTVGGNMSTLLDVSVQQNLDIQSSMTVKQEAYAFNVERVSTLAVFGNVSTTSLDIGGDLLVKGNFSIPGTATLNALGAPIEISLSTLTLSNTLTVTNSADIPIFTSISNVSFPTTTEIGPTTGFTGFLKADTANLRGSLQDYNPVGDRKAVSTTRISTLTGVNLLSTFRIGSSNLTTPLIDASGLLLLGSNVGQSNAYTFTPVDFSIKNQTLQFSTIAWGASFSPSNSIWVSVGENSNQAGTIQYSTDKTRTWQPAVTGGFAPSGPLVIPSLQAGVGRDVIYMSTTFQNTTPPVWVATGKGVNLGMMGNVESIQYSGDGSNWSNASGTVFPTTTQGGNRLCVHRFNVASNGAVLLAAGDRGLGLFGVLFSQNGITWTQATAGFGPTTFNSADITVGAFRNLYTVGTLSPGFGPPTKALFTAQECNYATGWSNISSNLNFAISNGITTFNTIAYGNNMYVIGGVPFGGSATNSIFYSPTLANWQPISQGGFTGGVQRIVFNDVYGIFLGVGSNTGGCNLQFSPNGIVWQSVPFTFPSPLYNLALGDGQISIPDPVSKFFTVNVESRFQSGISSLYLTTSTIAASSFTANIYIGSATGLSNLTNFGRNMYVSSILTQNFYYGSTLYYAGSTTITTLSTTESATLIASDFFSTGILTIATGVDSLSNGNIQLSGNREDWVRASNNNFEYYASEVIGNNNLFNPLFVATGADSQTNKSIQYSLNGTTWNPVESGGFSIGDSDGYKSGNTVATLYYASTITSPPFFVVTGPRWLVGGNALGSASTIFYSDDGSNFQSATNSSALLNSISKLKADNTFSLALNSSNYIVNSSNGIVWTQTNSPYQFTAFAYGFTPFLGFTWIALDSLGGYYTSYDNGSNWNLAIANTFVYDAFDMIYASNSGASQFYAISSNSLYSRDTNSPYTWNQVLSPFSLGATSFTSLYWSETQQKWFLGAQAASAQNTIFTASLTGNTFTPILSGGFSSGTVSVGGGYGIAISSSLVLAGGTGAFTSLTATKPQILRVSGAGFPPTPTRSTVTLLSQENASNVFQTSVYGLGIASSIQTYSYVAVGDGAVPQKTIARSSNLTNWIPAITGGFSPAGYGVTYYENSNTGSNFWIAVGKAAASTATIQYSDDGANWFATNNSSGIPFGGRGIAQISSLGRVVVVGEAPGTPASGGDKRTIVYSDDGYTWSNANMNNGFNYAGYGIAEGYIGAISQTGLIAVGKPYGADPSTVDTLASIQTSTDGLGWGNATSGGFTVAGYGVAYGRDYLGVEKWVAVGENSPGSTSNIQYSTDGYTWTAASYPTQFFYAGYGVAYSHEQGMFIAVGKSISNTESVLYSGDGSSWIVLTNSNSGFKSEESFGTTYGFFSQEINRLERFPFIQFPKLVVYQRTEPFNYNLPSIRIQSTLVTFNETLSVNLSSQVMINTYTPENDYTVTVNGNIVTSTFIFKGLEPTYRDIQLSSLVVSTLQINQYLGGKTLTTPSLGIGLSELPTTLDAVVSKGISYTAINETLYTRHYGIDTWGVGIATLNPTAHLDVTDTTATSSLTTSVYIQNSEINLQQPNQVFLNSSNLAMFTGANPRQVTGRNTIYSEVSSLTFNNTLTMNLSSQRIGIYTTNPQFDFDAKTAGYLERLETQTVTTESLFLTLQSL